MGDDFFEDQVEEEAPSKSKAPDEGSKAVKKSLADKVAGSDPKGTAKVSAKEESPGTLSLPQQVDLMWAIALIVVAFVIGFFVRGLFEPPASTMPALNNGISTYGPGASGDGGAPVLTPEQLEKGELPQGHPPIGGETTQSAEEEKEPDKKE